MLQTFELGRQNLKRVKKVKSDSNKNKFEQEIETKTVLLDNDEMKKLIIENVISSFKTKKNRNEEMKFLKMLPDDKLDPG